MNNPNLAWFIACVCCFVCGAILQSDEYNKVSFAWTYVKYAAIGAVGAITYAAISYWIL